MGNSWFQFKQFRVNQDRTAMKISTDAVLLGALAAAVNVQEILDIGSGTGILALMLAQRFPEAKILGVELDQDAASQAQENIRESIFADRIQIRQMRIQDFETSVKFDLAVSNPPYFPDHLKSSDRKRNQALHTDQLSFLDLIEKVVLLLKEEGAFWVILPPRQMLDFIRLAEQKKLYPYEINQVRDQPGKRIQREIVGFSFRIKDPIYRNIWLKDEGGKPHETYRSLVSRFLLNF